MQLREGELVVWWWMGECSVVGAGGEVTRMWLLEGGASDILHRAFTRLPRLTRKVRGLRSLAHVKGSITKGHSHGNRSVDSRVFKRQEQFTQFSDSCLSKERAEYIG